MVSIIITCYEDDRQFVYRAIESCKKQNVEHEIIIVDGGSEIPYDLFSPDIYIYTKENIMQGGAMNLGIKNAKYDLILPLDADDMLYPNILEWMVSESDGVDVIYGNITNVYNGDVLKPMNPTRENALVCNPIFWTSLLRKSACEFVGGFERVIYQDYKMWCKMIMFGCKFKYINKTIYNHQIRKGSITDRERERIEELNEEARKPLYG